MDKIITEADYEAALKLYDKINHIPNTLNNQEKLKLVDAIQEYERSKYNLPDLGKEELAQIRWEEFGYKPPVTKVTITTWEGNVFEFEYGSAYKVRPDKFDKLAERVVIFNQNRADFLRYESSNNCGISHTGYERLLSCYPYKDWWEQLEPVTVDYANKLRAKINDE